MTDAQREQRASAGIPFFIYPYPDRRESLEVPAKNEARHPHDAYFMEFINQLDG